MLLFKMYELAATFLVGFTSLLYTYTSCESIERPNLRLYPFASDEGLYASGLETTGSRGPQFVFESPLMLKDCDFEQVRYRRRHVMSLL
jgi:hypothetical protein